DRAAGRALRLRDRVRALGRLGRAGSEGGGRGDLRRVLHGDAGRDGGAGRADRGGQVHDREADGAVLRRHRRRGAGGRGGRAGLRPDRVPAAPGGGAAGGVPVQRDRGRGDRLRAPVRVRCRGRGGGGGG